MATGRLSRLNQNIKVALFRCTDLYLNTAYQSVTAGWLTRYRHSLILSFCYPGEEFFSLKTLNLADVLWLFCWKKVN